MSRLSLRLPDSLHNQIRALAKKEGVSIGQLLASAASEKVAALLTEEYREERARRASGERFRAVLDKVARVSPAPEDDLPQK